MKPILYTANATNFFNLGLGVLSDTYSCLVYEKRNGAFYLEMEYPVEGALFKELQNNRLIKADAGHELKDQGFKIKKITKPIDGKVKVYAEHISYKAAELALKPHVNIRNATAQQALQQWQNNFIDDDKPFTLSSNITTVNSTSWSIREIENPRQALGGVQGSILDVWGGEYKFDNYHISLFRERGVRANALIAYGRNITDFEQEEDITSVYTSIYPYGVYTDEDGVEHLVTIPEYIVDSEHVDKYPNRMVLPVDFTTEFGSEETPTVQRLRSMAQSYIGSNEIGIPKVSIRLTHVDLSKTLDYKQYKGLEKVNLCDNVLVKFLKLGVDTTAKVIGIIWNVLLERYEELEIGESRSSLSSRLNAIDQEARQARKEASDARNFSAVAANGINMVFFGPDEPTATKVGDRWFEENGEFTISRVWDGVIWRVIHDPRITDDNKRAIEAQQQEIQDAKDSADAANQQINDAIQNAGFTTLNDLTSDLRSISESTQLDAADALNNSIDALTDARSALSGLSDVQSSMSDIQIDIDEIEGTLALKASQTDLNSITGIVDQHTLDIQANAEGLTAKADSSRVDTLSGDVTTLSNQLNFVSGELSSKISQTQLNAAIEDVEIGGRNYLISSLELKQPWIFRNDVSREVFNGNEYMVKHIAGGTGRYAGYNTSNFGFDFTDGDQWYTISVIAKGNIDQDIAITLDAWNLAYGRQQLTNEWQVFSWSFKGEFRGLSTFRFVILGDVSSENPAYWRRPKVELGSKKTDWTQAPEDTAELISHIQSEWTQTFDGFQSTVSSIDGRVTQQRQDLDSVTTSIGNAEGQIATLQSTVSGIQSTVADKASQTEVTQLSNAIALKVGTSDVESLILQDRTIKDTRNDNRSPDWYQSNYPRQTVKEFKSRSTMGISAGENFGVLITEIPWSNSSGGEVKQTFYLNNRTYIRSGINSWSDWQEIPHKSYVDSQITVVQNAINLRVSKGDVLSQINIEAGRTLIQSDRLLLNANSVTFTGSAFIPNAAIQSLSADKLTAGTIDASQINVINLDASDITAGTISGANMYLSLNAGHFHSEGTYEEEAISFNPGDHAPFVFPAYVDIRDGVITSTNPDSGLGGRLTEIAAGTIYMVSNPDSSIRSDIQLSGGGIQFGQGARAGAISPGSGFIMQDHNNDRHAQYNYDGLTLARSERDIYFGVDGLRLSNGAYIERIGPVSDGMIWSVPGFMDFWSWGARAFAVYEGGVNYFRNLTMTGSNNNINARNINANETDLLRLNGTRNELADLTLGAYSGGQRYFRSSAVYDLSISSTSQVGITASGDFRRITSARKYKIDITTADNQLDLGRRLLSLDLTKWFDKGDTERYAEALTNGSSFEGIEPIKMHYGLIAEDVEEAGLSQFVDYQNGEVEGIYYDRLWIPLIAVVRDHDELLESTTSMASSNVLRIEKLEKENKKLKERIAALEGAA